MKSIQKNIEEDFSFSLASLLEGINPPFQIIAAFSGGPDSTALLHLLQRYKKQFSYDLAAVYINHGIRSPQDCLDEETEVEFLCRQLEIALYKKKYPPGFLEHYARKKGCGLEAAARTYRYHSFEKIAARSKIPVFFALGHNQNDQIETVLMRLLAGSSIEGLKGIAEKRGAYIRPLLKTRRQDIDMYLKQQNLTAVIDKSNLETDFLRNKVRLDLLPAMAESFPAVHDAIIRFNYDLKEILEHYNKILETSCPLTITETGAVSWAVDDFQELPFVSRKSLVLTQINNLQKGLYSARRIPASFFNPLATLKEGIVLKGHGIILKKKNKRLFLSLQANKECDQEITLFYYIDKDHPYGADSYTIMLENCSELLEDDYILQSNYNADSSGALLIRSALNNSELSQFSLQSKDECLLLFQGNKILCALNSKKIFFPKNGNYVKSNSNISAISDQCVIIRYRGHYAPE